MQTFPQSTPVSFSQFSTEVTKARRRQPPRGGCVEAEGGRESGGGDGGRRGRRKWGWRGAEKHPVLLWPSHSPLSFYACEGMSFTTHAHKCAHTCVRTRTHTHSCTQTFTHTHKFKPIKLNGWCTKCPYTVFHYHITYNTCFFAA